MEKRRLGNSDLHISVMGMGCWQFGGGESDFWGVQHQQDVNRVVDQALDKGLNYFDTAEVYNEGRSEISLGIALKGKRNRAVIGTKVSPSNAFPGEITESCEASLKRLQIDYIDLYMLHWPLNSVSIKHYTDNQYKIANPPQVHEVFHELESLQREGKIRYIGVSNHGIRQMSEINSTHVIFVANQLPYNLFSRAIEKKILPYCIKNNVGVIGYSPLQQGLLTGKIGSIDQVHPTRALSRHYNYTKGIGARHGEEGAENEINKALKKLQDISNNLGISINVLALAWIISNKGITTTIVGSRNIDQLSQNLKAENYKLTSDIIEELNKVTKPILNKLGNNPDNYENRSKSRIS